MPPTIIDRFFIAHPWASDIAGSLLGVFITAFLFVAGIIYERRRQRALDTRLHEDTLYYFEQLLNKVIDWAEQLSRAYGTLAAGLRRAPLLTPEFGQYSDYAAERLLEIDRQVLFRAFLHRYGRGTSTIDLYVSLYDSLDYLITQAHLGDDERANLRNRSLAQETQFRKQLDALLTQATAAASGPDAPLADALLEVLPQLHELALPGGDLEETWRTGIAPLRRLLTEQFGQQPGAQPVLLRVRKLTAARAALLRQAGEASTSFALLGTSLRLGAGTLRTAARKMRGELPLPGAGAGASPPAALPPPRQATRSWRRIKSWLRLRLALSNVPPHG